MKPLSPAPLTDEDYEIWYSIDVRSSAQYPPCLRAHWADRRDADLMYVGASSRGVVTWNNLDPEPTLVLLRGAPLC